MSEEKTLRSFFDQMTGAQLLQVWQACEQVRPQLVSTPLAEGVEPDAEMLESALGDASHVDVVIACGGVPDGSILEILMSGSMIDKRVRDESVPHRRPNGSRSTPRTPRVAAAKVPKGPPPEDTRIIVSVRPNPKKEGSGAHTRYAHYRVGDTVAMFLAKGGTPGDVKYDLAKGFITLGEAAASPVVQETTEDSAEASA